MGACSGARRSSAMQQDGTLLKCALRIACTMLYMLSACCAVLCVLCMLCLAICAVCAVRGSSKYLNL